MNGIKISSLEVENLKRVRVVQMVPSEDGLTIIGGNNGQGKTSVLDAIAWALGGEKFRPSNPKREESANMPRIRVTLSNGLTVERSGKNGALKVTDPTGRKSGQQLLNEFVEVLALDLPRFMRASGKEKAETLLQIIGVGDQLHALEHQEERLYNQRHTLGQEADRKRKFADEMPTWPDVPSEPVSAYDLIQRQQAILRKNAENQQKRGAVATLEAKKDSLTERIHGLEDRIEELTVQLKRLKTELIATDADLADARKDAQELHDESTAAIEEDIHNIETLNAKIRANMEAERADEEANRLKDEYDELTKQIENTRAQKLALLDGAKLPLHGLSVDAGELTYRGQRWDGMSGAEQLKVATAIVRAVNPKCGFVLLDKLEQMDRKTLKEFGEWLETEGLQVIATRVSTGDECSIIIEDGVAVPGNAEQAQPKWKKGVF